jgi:hypothetical protein
MNNMDNKQTNKVPIQKYRGGFHNSLTVDTIQKCFEKSMRNNSTFFVPS